MISISNGYPVAWDRRTNEFDIIYQDKDGLSDFMPSSYVRETDSTWLISNNSLPLLRWNKTAIPIRK